MRHLEGYTKYPFEGIEVGRSKFAEFILILINRLVASGVVAYATIIVELKDAYNNMFGEISQRMQDFTQQLAETKEIQNIRTRFNKFVDDLEVAVQFKFGKGSDEQEKFFPHGITVCKRAPLFNFLVTLENLKTLCDSYQGSIGTQFLTDITTLIDDFKQERDNQLQYIGKVKSIIPHYKEKKEAMIVLTYKAMLTILLENVNNPEVMLTFFDEALIWPKHHEVLDVVIAAHKRQAADIKFDETNTIIMANVKGKDLLYFFGETADALPPENPDKLATDEEVTIKCDTIPPIKKFLIFINNSTFIIQRN